MVIDFFKAAAGLKGVPRQGWIEKLGMDGPESVADHSYVTAVVCMVFSDLGGHDTEKVLKMALLHDLAESVTGDITPGRADRDAKARAEDRAFESIAAALPGSVRAQYAAVWKEYAEGRTAEAKLVHQADKLEMALQARLYGDGGARGDLGAFFSSARAGISDPAMSGLLGEITGGK